MKKAIISLLIVYILICINLISFVMISPEGEVLASAKTIIVDDNGTPGIDCNYTHIQWAIDNASAGDTVFVKNGTYYENVLINKSINLIGENKNITIINGSGIGGTNTVSIIGNWVNITDFTIKGSGDWSEDAGIKINDIQNCQITNNYILFHEKGIYIRNSNNVSLTDNNISSKYIDIYLYYSNHTSILNNNMNYSGICIYGSYQEQWNSHNIDTSNKVSGKPVQYRKNQKGGSIPIGAGQVILANCTNMKVENQDLEYCFIGIQLGYSSENDIVNNRYNGIKISYGVHGNGIYLHRSNNNNIYNNNISNSTFGIYLWRSSFNVIAHNIAMFNEYGIYVRVSDDNEIKYNVASSYTSWDYWGCGFVIRSSERNMIKGNIASYNWVGIICYSAIGDIGNNTFIYNTLFSNNDTGLYIGPDLYNNVIYHNNFINNTNQSYDGTNNGNKWDNGYPSGGNYWNDYIGNDFFSGPNQNISGSDGIGDTNYSIDPDSIDNYPLMLPIGNSIFLHKGWNLISIPFIQPDTTLNNLLNPIAGSYNAVQWYNVNDTSDPWKHNHTQKQSHLNDLDSINHKMGFWIHITKPDGVLFRYSGTQPTLNQTITLYPGWNLVGYPSQTSHNRTIGLNNLTFGTHVDAIWTYNSATQRWEHLEESDYFQAGKGYYIHAKTKCIWEVPI